MKCQRCTKAATLHITEVLSEENVQEAHLCEDCANKYLTEPEKDDFSKNLEVGPSEGITEAEVASSKECSMCGVKFSDFRNSGRLGCPNDYLEFRDELLPYLENIHGETKHCGKMPGRMKHVQSAVGELLQLRKLLQSAIQREAYEEAANLRDQIRKLEAE